MTTSPASNYPIIKFTQDVEILGIHFNVDSYARTFNWSSAGVATGSAIVSTQFNLPAGHSSLSDFESVVVIANGIPSISVASRANPNLTGQTNQTADEGASKGFSLGSFNDPDGGPWSVDVNWGDGTSHTTFNTSTNGSLGTPNHIYGEEGNFTATVTVTDDTGLTGSATFQVAVADLAVNAAGGFAFSAVEGALSSTQTVATFTDPGGAEPNPSDPSGVHYAATIDWGDGTAPTSGTVNFSGSQGSKTDSFTVSASHNYGEEGSYAIKVTINHEGKISSTTSTATVTDPAVDLAGGFGFSAVEGSDSATQTVATFKDPGGAEPNSSDPGAIADHYTATIDWGDGTGTTTGTISFSGTQGSKNDSFTVSADHTYGEEGTFTIKVTIDHEGQISSATSTATVTDPAVDTTGGFSLLTARGAPLCDVTVATFKDPGGAEPNSFDPSGVHYTATIDWGDGTAASTGDISFSGTPGSKTDSYTVTGDHVYVGNGTYTITVTIDHETIKSTTTSTATVKSVAIGQGPCDANTLLIGGTLAGDTIVVNPINSKTGTVQVQINNEPAVIIDGASYSSIAVYAQDSNDSVQLSGTIARDAFLFGEDGSDRLKGGGGNNFIYGGNGNDILIADTKSNFSILIGGAGADQLNGNGGGDILIGGDVDFADPTNCDNNPKICKVLSAWIGTPGQSYSARVAAADAVLSGHVLNDSVADTVNGGPGLDLFYASLGDILKGNQKGETIKLV